MTLQEQFEEWALSKKWCIEKTNGVYNNTIVGCALEAWVASRESVVVEVPDFVEGSTFGLDYDDMVIAELEKAGVSYK